MGESWTVVGMFDWQWLIALGVVLLVGMIVGAAAALILRRSPVCVCQRDMLPVAVPVVPPRTRGASPQC